MNKEVLTNKEVSDALHCLFHCAKKDKGYGSQYEQFRLVYDYINQLETNRDEVLECIKEFLCTEEYIKVDGIAIANNYAEIVVKLERGKE